MNLERRLGLWDAVSLVVGITLGAGIFVVPGLVARQLPSPLLIFAAWIFAGALSLLGALVFAELGASMPATGGHYVFIREAIGPMAAFLCGWTYFIVIQPAVVAYLATSFAVYLSYFVPLAGWKTKAVALSMIAVLCGANYIGTRWGASVQNFFTAMKLSGLAVLVVSAFTVSNPRSLSGPLPAWSVSGFGVALIACLLSYEGWAYLSFVAGEVRNPQRNLLRAVAIGLAICTVVYLLVNVAYMRVLSVEEFASSERPGSEVAQRALGSWNGAVVTITILCSIVGSANGQILAPARVYFAQAKDGLFFPRFAKIHPRFRTPSAAITGVGLWSALLTVCGVWETLIDFAMFATWVFTTLVGVALILLRRRDPGRERPYRLPGYPWTAYLFVTVGAAFLANTMVERPRPSLIATAIILAGIPAFRVTLKQWTNSSTGAANSRRSIETST